MRDPNQVLSEKLQQYKQLLKEINALRVVMPMLDEPEPKKDQTNES